MKEKKDAIRVEGIKKYLPDKISEKLTIKIVDETGSTNSDVKLKAQKGENEGYLLVAQKQTDGRGRMGRTFFSPGETGVYMSLLLRPRISAEDSVLITTAAAVSVCNALDDLGVNGSRIKWVNDIFLGSKKVCGILTEGGFSPTEGRLSYVVLGVGANIYYPSDGFPQEIKGIAGSVAQEKEDDLRNRFVASFLVHFMDIYRNLDNRNHLEQYKERCFVLGEEVVFSKEGKSFTAIAKDIDEKCGLVVEFSDKRREILRSGEISVTIRK